MYATDIRELKEYQELLGFLGTINPWNQVDKEDAVLPYYKEVRATLGVAPDGTVTKRERPESPKSELDI